LYGLHASADNPVRKSSRSAAADFCSEFVSAAADWAVVSIDLKKLANN
jgi:hypothetical protein